MSCFSPVFVLPIGAALKIDFGSKRSNLFAVQMCLLCLFCLFWDRARAPTAGRGCGVRAAHLGSFWTILHLHSRKICSARHQSKRASKRAKLGGAVRECLARGFDVEIEIENNSPNRSAHRSVSLNWTCICCVHRFFFIELRNLILSLSTAPPLHCTVVFRCLG